MAKSVLEIQLKLIRSSVLTINEVRALEGLEEIYSMAHTGAVKAHRLPILEDRKKVVCEYCARPNKVERELCASCGAPLKE